MGIARRPLFHLALATVLVSSVAACGAPADDEAAPALSSPLAPALSSLPAPARATTTSPAEPAPAPTATGQTVWLSDGHAVAALDTGSGAVTAQWPSATPSLHGDVTIAVDPSPTAGVTEGTGTASWYDGQGRLDHAGPIPAGMVPGVTSADGRWAVFADPAPERVGREIGPRRTTSHFVVTDGLGWSREFTLAGNFTPEAFGWIEGEPRSLQLIEYLPPERPAVYRVRTLDLATSALGLPVSIRDKATPVDEAMAGASRTQVSAADAGLLFTLYEATAGEGTWEYGFVHTLATSWSGVWCIDLPEELQLAHSAGALALSQDQRTLYVVSGEGRVAEIPVDDLGNLRVARTADLGVVSEDPPAITAGTGVLWVALGGQLLAVDPSSLDVVARADAAAPVRSLLAVRTGDERSPQGETVLAADTAQLRSWSLNRDGTALSEATSSVSLPNGLGTISRMVLPR